MPASPAARDISPTKCPPAPVSNATLPSKPNKEVRYVFILANIVAEEEWSVQIRLKVRLSFGIFLVTEATTLSVYFYISTILCHSYPSGFCGAELEPMFCLHIILNRTNDSTSQPPLTWYLMARDQSFKLALIRTERIQFFGRHRHLRWQHNCQYACLPEKLTARIIANRIVCMCGAGLSKMQLLPVVPTTPPKLLLGDLGSLHCIIRDSNAPWWANFS